MPENTAPSDGNASTPDIRDLTPSQRYVEGTLLMPVKYAEPLEKYSDWLSAGAGAVIIALVSREDLPGMLSASPRGVGFLLIAGSVLFGVIAKMFRYTAIVLGDSGTGGIALITKLARSVSSQQEFLKALEETRVDTKPRLRLLQRPLVSWIYRKPPTDKLAIATWVSAADQYLFSFTFIQFIALVGGVVLFIIPELV